jgi:LysM repeat protein
MKKLVFLGVLGCFLNLLAWSQETVRVEQNQTLWAIARLHGVSVQQLKSWNGLSSDSLAVGQPLIVQPPKTPDASNSDLGPFLYTVHRGDSLSELALRYGEPLDVLRQINGFSNDTLTVGERIFVRRPVGITFYTVQSGDVISVLALRFNIDVSTLRAINQLSSDQLYPGQVLRVFKPQEVPLTHIVAPSDTLPGIAALYNTTPANLRTLNDLTSDVLVPGQVLKLKRFASASTPAVFQPRDPRLVENSRASLAQAESVLQGGSYTVQAGDSLYRIAREHAVSVADLSSWNNIGSDGRIFVGQKLLLGPAQNEAEPSTAPDLPAAAGPVAFPSGNTTTSSVSTTPVSLTQPVAPVQSDSGTSFLAPPKSGTQPWDHYVIMDPNIPVFEWNGDYYYWTHPGAVSQPNRGYFENNWPSPLDAYRKAREIWRRFAAMVAQKPFFSHKLDGWTIVLDPGHGGLDPGTIVKTPGPNGTSLYITEAQYVYDIALRMYELLVRNGARVETTTLAPNHLILDTTNPDTTLVNEKNIVYNDLIFNEADDSSCWPQGSIRGLEKRVEIAKNDFRGATHGKRLFISLHADNNPGVPIGTGIYTYAGRDGTTDEASQHFAQKMLPYLGTGAYTRAEPLIVLKNNPADFKMLIETHNLALPAQAWLMRFGSTRENDARTLVKAIIDSTE